MMVRVHPAAPVEKLEVKMSKLRVIKHGVLVQPAANEEVSKGGIVIPGTAQRDSNMAKVIAVGELVNVPDENSMRNGDPQTPNIKPGQIILYMPHTGVKVTVNGEKLVVVRDADIIGIFEEPGK